MPLWSCCKQGAAFEVGGNPDLSIAPQAPYKARNTYSLTERGSARPSARVSNNFYQSNWNGPNSNSRVPRSVLPMITFESNQATAVSEPSMDGQATVPCASGRMKKAKKRFIRGDKLVYGRLPKMKVRGTSRAVQWLRLQASNAGGTGLIPGRFDPTCCMEIGRASCRERV